MSPKSDHSPFYMKSTFTKWIPQPSPLDNLIPISKTIMNVLVDGKPTVMEFTDAQMKKIIELSFKNKEQTMFKKIINWLADNYFFTNDFKFIRKHAGGRWEKWFVGLPICKAMWFRGNNSHVSTLTSEGLPLLRAILEEEEWN